MGILTARADGSRPGLVPVALAALPVGLVLSFVVFMLLGVEVQHLGNLAVALVTASVAVVPAIVDQGRSAKDRHILLTLVSLAWGLYYVLPVFTRYFLTGGHDPTSITTLSAVTPEQLLAGQLTALLALALLLIGYSVPFAKPFAELLPTPRHEWSPGSCIAVAAVIIPLGWAIYLGGQFGLIPKRAGSGVLGVLASGTIYGIALLSLVYFKYRARLALPLLMMTIPPTMAFNFFTGSKGLFFAPLAIVFVTHVIYTRKIRMRWVVVGITALSLFYPIAQFYREVVQEGNTKGAVDVLQNPGDALGRVSAYASRADFGDYFIAGLEATTVRFQAISITSFIVRDTPARVPYQNGWTIGYIFLSYVPRVLWPGKPDTTIGQWVTDHYMGGSGIRSNTGPSWVGEIFMNFGYPGIVIGMLILGFYFRMLQSKFFSPGATIPAAWFGIMFVYNTVPQMSGGLVGPINSLGFYGGLVLAIHLVVRTLAGTWVPTGTTTPARVASNA